LIGWDEILPGGEAPKAKMLWGGKTAKKVINFLSWA